MECSVDDAPEEWNPQLRRICRVRPSPTAIGLVVRKMGAMAAGWRSTTPHPDAACAESTPHGGAGMPCGWPRSLMRATRAAYVALTRQRKARMPCATDAPLAHEVGAKLPVLPTPTRAHGLLVSNRSQLAALSTNTKRRRWLQPLVRLDRADVGASRLEHMSTITWGWSHRSQPSVAKAMPQDPTTWSRSNTCPSINASYDRRIPSR